MTLTVVLNLKVHHWGERGRKMPRWVRRFTRKVLARITCLKPNKVDVDDTFDIDVGKLTPTSKEYVREKDRIFVQSKPPSPIPQNVEETDNYTCEDVALMLDKICFVVFCVLDVVITLAILLTIVANAT